jgi:hypothetical protein
LFKASEKQYLASEFHKACDSAESTLTVIRSTAGKVFGAYTPNYWGKNNGYIKDDKKEGFIFSLNHKTLHEIKNEKSQYAIYSKPTYGPTFGEGHDICISDQCQIRKCKCILGNTYELPKKYDVSKARAYLAGEVYFLVDDYIVYGVY